MNAPAIITAPETVRVWGTLHSITVTQDDGWWHAELEPDCAFFCGASKACPEHAVDMLRAQVERSNAR